MSDEIETQPAVTLSHISFTKGEIEGKPCVVVYDCAADKTTVIGAESKGWDQAMMALAALEFIATPMPKSQRSPKTVISLPTKPKLILPGSNASN